MSIPHSSYKKQKRKLKPQKQLNRFLSSTQTATLISKDQEISPFQSPYSININISLATQRISKVDQATFQIQQANQINIQNIFYKIRRVGNDCYQYIIIVIFIMRGALGRGKHVLLQREHQRNFQKHLDRIRQIRPNSTGWEWSAGQPTLNQQKKHRMMEDKITEIQRENRCLLQKITYSIGKRQSKDTESENNMNKSLNYSFRKKQIQTIDSQNLKLLKRLQEKKSNYDRAKLKQQWKKQKYVIKNIANFPFVLNDGSRRHRRKVISKMEVRNSMANDKPFLQEDFQLIKVKKFNKINMEILLKFNREGLYIFGNEKGGKNIKLIQIPYDQALLLINFQCSGKIEKVIDKIEYDDLDGVLKIEQKVSKNIRKSQQEIIKQKQQMIDNLQHL